MTEGALNVAFYAPMKPPHHPVPSGDRQIARLTMTALKRAGFEVSLSSELRVLDIDGDPARQARLLSEAEVEVARIVAALRSNPPALWYSYHCHYKAPDLIGPQVADALGIPYVLSEPSISPKRRSGPWANFAAASDKALARADLLFWTTERDRPMLQVAGYVEKMRHLPAFIDTANAPRVPAIPRISPGEPLRLLTTAMMRPGYKRESYRRLAAGLGRLGDTWSLDIIGDGPDRTKIEAMMAEFGGRVRFRGAIDDPAAIRAVMEEADIFLWPGVGEGVGLVWLEAHAAGLPVIAEDGPAARALVHAGRLTPPDDAEAFAQAIRDVASDLAALSGRARQSVQDHHSLDAAADRLASYLGEVLP